MIPPGPESMTGLRGQPPPQLVFGPFELDRGTGVLREGDRSIPLAAKPFELLLYLARRPGRIVSRRELLDVPWPGGCANGDAVVRCVVEARRALGGAVRDPRCGRAAPLQG